MFQEHNSVADQACAQHHMPASKAPPVLVSLLGVIHESVEELVGILLLDLLALWLQGLDGPLVLLLTLAQVLLGELQEALAVDGPAVIAPHVRKEGFAGPIRGGGGERGGALGLSICCALIRTSASHSCDIVLCMTAMYCSSHAHIRNKDLCVFRPGWLLMDLCTVMQCVSQPAGRLILMHTHNVNMCNFRKGWVLTTQINIV